MVEWKKLGEVCVIKNGYTPSTKENSYWENGTLPWFTLEDIRKNGRILEDAIKHITSLGVKKGGLFPKDSIIVSTTATIGEYALIKSDFLCNQQITCLTIKTDLKEQLLPKYLYYLSDRIGKWCKKNVNGGGSLLIVSTSKLNNFLIPIPSIEEQNRIVGILDTFTASIDNLKEQIAQRRKQYEYYRDQLLDLEEKDIEEILSFGNDFQLKARIGWQGLTKREYKDSGDYKLVTGTDFTGNLRIDFDSCVFVDKERYEQDEYIKLKVGDVLITKDGTLGKVAYIEKLDIPATLNGGVFVVRDPKKKIIPKFILYYLTSYHFKKWMQQNHTTGSIQHLTQKLLSSFTIPVLPVAEQQRIVSILDTFEASIQNLEAQLSQREKQYEYYRNKLLTFE